MSTMKSSVTIFILLMISYVSAKGETLNNIPLGGYDCQHILKDVFHKKTDLDFKNFEISTNDWNAFLDRFIDGPSDLTPEQKHALFITTVPSINKPHLRDKLRAKDQPATSYQDWERRYVFRLDSAFRDNILEEGMIILRGITGDQLRVKSLVKDGSYSSATIRPKIAYGFSVGRIEKKHNMQTALNFLGHDLSSLYPPASGSPGIILLKVPRGGHPAAAPLVGGTNSVTQTELEILLPRGTRYRILSKESRNGVIIYWAELLPYRAQLFP